MQSFQQHRSQDGTVCLVCNGREFILLGTAHVSQRSSEQAQAVIEQQHPDTVCVELDQQRYQALTNQEHWRHLNVFQIIKQGKGGLLLVSLLLSSFQRRVGEQVGTRPGQEMLSAIASAQALGIPVEMVDRPVEITMRRAWRKCSLWSRMKLLSLLISSFFSKEKVSSEEIEQLKSDDMLHQLTLQLAQQLPQVKTVLIDERDCYLAQSIFAAPGKKVVAIVGAGHIPGIVAYLEQLHRGESPTSCQELRSIPAPSKISRFLPWLLPLLLLLLIGLGFLWGGRDTGTTNLVIWLVGNGVPALLTTLFALAHPLTILAAGLAAPFTALIPAIGVGMVAALVELLLRKPQVEDLERLHHDLLSLKGWYRNRIGRSLLVFIFSNIGGVGGTYLATYLITHNLFS